MVFKRKEQGMSGILQTQAKHLSKNTMDKFMINMYGKILGLKKGVRKFRMKHRRAVYAYCFSVIKKLAGAGHVIASNTVRIPNSNSFLFNCTWDKTLTMGSHCFGITCVMKKDTWCAHCIIDDYVSEAKTFAIDLKKGLLFPKVNNDDSSHIKTR